MTLLRNFRFRAGSVVLVAVLSVAACGADRGGPEDRGPAPSAGPGVNDLVRPTASPSAAKQLQPSDRQAPGTREVSGKYFSIRMPSSFQAFDQTPQKGEAILYHPAGDPGIEPVKLMIVGEPNPRSSADEQSYILESMNKDAKDTTVERSTIEWPGAQHAVLTWIERPPGLGNEREAMTAGSEGKRMAIVQIYAQMNKDLIVGAVIYGPADKLESSGLLDCLRSFRPKAA